MNMEKVIKGLECCKRKDGNECKVCPYTESDFCVEDMVTDAIAMLKEQEAIEPGADSGMCEICSFYERALPVKPHYNARTNWYECGACHYSMTSGTHCRSELIPAYKVGFCAKCGKAVNWELTIRYIQQNSREDTCKNCPALEADYNSDESYCNLSDGEEVRLKRGQHRPEWCPKRAWKK